MADGFSTESGSVAVVFMAGHITAEWVRQSPAVTPEQAAKAYEAIYKAVYTNWNNPPSSP